MQTDFMDAHERHLEDANILFSAQRWANADHLFGVAAECGLKCLMIKFGMPFSAEKDKPSDPKDTKHIDEIWVRFETYRSGCPLGAGYALGPIQPFTDWKVEQRYAHQQDFNQTRAEPHCVAAEEIHSLVRKALYEGIL